MDFISLFSFFALERKKNKANFYSRKKHLKMNCNQARKISIRTVLESFSLFPSKENSKSAFYFALDRDEKTPSLSVDFTRNSAFDFGTGKKYDNISIVQAVKKCSVEDALKYLKNLDLTAEIKYKKIEIETKKTSITVIKKVQHPALLEYLKLRKITKGSYFLNEIHYQVSEKKYFGIGFKNDSDGYEIRNKFSKICLGKKDFTTIKNGSNQVKIFEGFFDFLSFLSSENDIKDTKSDYIILNSLMLIPKLFECSVLEKYGDKVQLFFDNDFAGDQATEEILKKIPASDMRHTYENFNDFNDWWCADNTMGKR